MPLTLLMRFMQLHRILHNLTTVQECSQAAQIKPTCCMQPTGYNLPTPVLYILHVCFVLELCRFGLSTYMFMNTLIL